MKIRVQAGARREAVLGLADGVLRIAVQAPPVEGAANRAVGRFLARCFHTRASRVRLVRGEKSKMKVVEITDLTPEMLARRIGELVGNSNETGNANNA